MSQKKSQFDGYIPWLIGAGALSGGLLIGYYIMPQIEKLLNPQPQENPNSKSKAETNPETETEKEEFIENTFPSPHFTRNIRPQLSARFSHSSVTKDRQSLEQRLLNKQALERMDLHTREQQSKWRPRNVKIEVPQNKRLTYGSDGHGGVVDVARTSRTRPRWRLKK